MVGFECIEETWKEPNELGHVCLAGQETPAVTLGLPGAELVPVAMVDVTTSLQQCGVENIVITSHDGSTNTDCATNEYTTANHYINKVVNRAISRLVQDITTIDDDLLEAHVRLTHDAATITETDVECPYVVGLQHEATSTERGIEVCANSQQTDACEETAICVDHVTQLEQQAISLQNVGTLKEAILMVDVGTMKELSIESLRELARMNGLFLSSVQDVGTIQNDETYERHASFTLIPENPGCTLSDANQPTVAAEHCAVFAPHSDPQHLDEYKAATSEFTPVNQHGTHVSLNDSPTWNTEEDGTIIDREAAESHDSRTSPKCVERIATFLQYTSNEHEHDGDDTVLNDGRSIQHVELTGVDVMSHTDTAKLQEGNDVSERVCYNRDENAINIIEQQCDYSIEMWSIEEPMTGNQHDLFATKEATSHGCILEPEGARNDDVSERLCCNDDETVVIEQCGCSIEMTDEACITNYQHDAFATKEETYYETIVEPDQLLVINSMETWNDMTCSVKDDVAWRLSSPDVGLPASVNVGDQLDIDTRNCAVGITLEPCEVVPCGQYEDIKVSDPFFLGEGPLCEVDRLSPCDSCMLVSEFETFDPEVKSNRFMEPLSHDDVACCLIDTTPSLQERKCWCDRLNKDVDKECKCDDRDGRTSLLDVEREKDVNVNNGGVDETRVESVVDIIRMIDESNASRTSSDGNIGRRERKYMNVQKNNETQLSVTYFGQHRICLTQCRSCVSDESPIKLDGEKHDGARYMNQHSFVDVGPTTEKPIDDMNCPGSLRSDIDRQLLDTRNCTCSGCSRDENLDVNGRIHNPCEPMDVSIIAHVADTRDRMISTTNRLMVDRNDLVMMSSEVWPCESGALVEQPTVESNATVQVCTDDAIPTLRMETYPTIDNIRAARSVTGEQIDNSDIIPSEVHDAAVFRLHQHTSAASNSCSDTALESRAATEDVRPRTLDKFELITSEHVASSDSSAEFHACGRTSNEFSVRVVDELSKRASHINSEEPSLISLRTHSVNTSRESGLPQQRKRGLAPKELPPTPVKYDTSCRTVASGCRSRLPLPHSSVLPKHIPSVSHPRGHCSASQQSLTGGHRSALPRPAKCSRNETQRCDAIDTSLFSLRKSKDASSHISGVVDDASAPTPGKSVAWDGKRVSSSNTKPTVDSGISSDRKVPCCAASCVYSRKKANPSLAGSAMSMTSTAADSKSKIPTKKQS